MKVTISFNGTKIVVPCGDGEISVREVTSLAATRYKKAIGKTNSYWVSVASLKSHEGGILDPDDLIGDVCDDREQLAAIFDEQNGGHYHGGGDGMSSASDSDTKESMLGGAPTSSAENLLQVRRGSEPALNKNDNVVVSTGSVQAAIASINARSSNPTRSMSSHAGLNPQDMQQPNNLRSSLRKTMVNYGYSVCVDQDRATQQSSPDSQYEDSGSLNVMRRREPLGASGNKPERPKSPKRQDNPDDEVCFEIVIPSELGQLGIHVVPCDIDGRLIVQGIEPGGRIDRDGRLAVEDAIVAINGYPLKETSFNKAQEIFKEALYAKELRLRILKGQGRKLGAENQPSLANVPVQDNVVAVTSNDQAIANTAAAASSKKTEMAAGTKITSAVHANNTRKIGKILKIALRKGSLGLGFSITTRDNALGDNTPIYIKNILPKGAAIEEGSLKPGDRLMQVNDDCVDGMSQSDVVTLLRNVPLDSTVNLVVSRHSVAPAEADNAAADEKMKNNSGRKLQFQLESNDNKTDEEPMDSLEPVSSMPSSSVSPGISSSGDNFDDMTSADSEFQFPWKQREILTFDIPVHDSERAGLGVSVKGKTSTSKDEVVDLGIFVKSVLHGGAASRDGRLMTNDQLVSINGMSLLGKANPSAMETLRKAMHDEGPVPGIISLTVARRKDASDPFLPFPQHSSQEGSSVVPPNTLARRDSLSSLPTSSDDEVVREYAVSAPNIQQQSPLRQPASTAASPPPPPPSFKMPSTSSLKNTRNPVIDRLMGKDASSSLLPSNLRNESYYMATNHETWNASMLQQHMLPPSTGGGEVQTSPNQSPDSVFIEQPTTNNLFLQNPQAPASDMNDAHDDDVTVTNEDQTNTGESLTSLVDFYPAFARDQPGRQSMSEKRHATLDAKATDTYQKRKKAREEREKQKQQLQQWKKSASLESLQLHEHGRRFHQHGGREDMSPYQRANSVRVSRNRGCNESFRAAVDRSYEKDFPEVGPSNDFVIRDLTNEPPAAIVAAKEEKEPRVVMRRSKSGGASSEERKKNRNSKLLRGLGTMFKLGSSSNQSSNNANNNVERTKDTKVMRKSMPGPEALTSASSIGSSTSATNSSHNSSRGQTKSIGDIPTDTYMQQLRLHPQQYVPQFQSRSHSQPRYAARPNNEVYEYMPSAMMRPGSRVGIADPSSSESPDYDVLHRLQNTHIQQQQPPPPPPTMRHQQLPPPPPPQPPSAMYHPHAYYSQPFYNQYGYHQQALPQIAHPRSGSNLSSGSSSGKPSRPKSNYYEYDYNNPASFASSSSSSQYYSSDHHPSMYSLPRSTSGYP